MNGNDNDDGAQRLFPRCGWILCSSVFLSFAVFLHLPRRSGHLQPVMTELRRCLNGGRYPLEDGAEEGEENQSFRGWYREHAGDVWQRCASVGRNAYLLLPGEHAPQSDATDFLASTQGAPDLEPPAAAHTLESLVDMVNTNVFSAA